MWQLMAHMLLYRDANPCETDSFVLKLCCICKLGVQSSKVLGYCIDMAPKRKSNSTKKSVKKDEAKERTPSPTAKSQKVIDQKSFELEESRMRRAEKQNERDHKQLRPSL